MNVSCPECRSLFRVDPAKVPSAGVRARCSICGGVIPVAAPVESDLDFERPPERPLVFQEPATARLDEDSAAAQRWSGASEGQAEVVEPTALSPVGAAGRASTPAGSAPAVPEEVPTSSPNPGRADAGSRSEAPMAARPVTPAAPAAPVAAVASTPPASVAPVPPIASIAPAAAPSPFGAVGGGLRPSTGAPSPFGTAAGASPAMPPAASRAPATPPGLGGSAGAMVPPSPFGGRPGIPPVPAGAPLGAGPGAATPPAPFPARPAGGAPSPFGVATPSAGGPPVPPMPGATTGGAPTTPSGAPSAPAPRAPMPPSPAPAASSPASAPAPVPAPAPSRPAAPAAGAPAEGRRPINPFLANDPNAKAKRLARALVSDIVAYHPQRRDEGLRDGTLKQLFREEIKKSYEEYVDQVGKEFAESTAHFQDALNDVLAGGKKMF